MTWFGWLGLALLVTAVAAFTGLQPKGSRPVARTGLMGMARLVLLAMLLILGYMAYRAGAGG